MRAHLKNYLNRLTSDQQFIGIIFGLLARREDRDGDKESERDRDVSHDDGGLEFPICIKYRY